MLYEVKNRLEAQRATFDREALPTVIISMTDSRPNIFYPQSWLLGVLHLQFFDVDSGKGCMTKRQAKEIAAFVRKWRSKAERLIVTCEFGQSRSPAVAAAICEAIEGNTGGFFGNKAYRPNPLCYRLVKEAMKKI